MNNLKRGVVWAVAFSAIVASGLTLLTNPKTEKTNTNHYETHFLEGGAVASQVLFSGEAPSSSLPSGFGGTTLFPGGNSGEEQFLSEEIVACLPYSSLYHGENMSYYCEQPVFVRDYFRNMTVEFPTNNDDRNCGYVAFSMLLSYYDTYWNSNFIEDKYNTSQKAHLDSLADTDFVSPGVKELNLPVWNADWYPHPEPAKPGANASSEQIQTYNNTLNSAFDNYLEQMTRQELVNQYLMSYLYSIGMEAGVLSYHTHPIPTISIEGLKEVSDKYFEHSEVLYCEPLAESLVEFHYSMYYSNDFSEYLTIEEKRAAVRNDMVERLEQGQPLILIGDLRGENNTIGGRHLVVAYEYDEQNDVIYGHSGGKAAGSSRINLDNAFFNIDGYGCFEVSSKVRYSQLNPRFEVNGEAHDTCDLSSHVHGYGMRFHYGNETIHAVQCPCGHTRYATHVFEKTKKGTKWCGRCGYFVNKGGMPGFPGTYGF